MKTQYGYAVLPDKVPTKRTKEKVHYPNGKSVYKILNESQPFDAYVRSDPFGGGQWLKFSTGEYDKNHRWALIKYKGSFVFNARPIAKSHVPINIRDIIGNRYDKYDGYINSGSRSNSIFTNF
ncbi:hypothetical protein [Apilactobacillus micheneri]|uniref:hypothetical protein n=1 Tax=Apilactobacillus micheneri TaxID=1899430 RepID=UPI000D038C04|nr:hypothetical protein [Apilactobacillus micheneri]TPR37793.1 hypothetical protein DY116_00795 [Apilactobacillus micheneri]